MKSTVLGLLLMLPVTQAYAETLPVIQTIANRIPQPETAALASVTVLTEADIARSTASNLPDLLQSLTGISIARNGGNGQPASLFLRGTESDHTLVLIDGIRLSSVSNGATALHFLPLGQISRIEIVRGPRSGLYGSEAIGGVISITTQRADKTHFNGEVKAGNFSSREGKFGFGWRQLATNLSMGFSVEETKGIDAHEAGNPDQDGYKNTAISGLFSHRFTDALSMKLTLLHSQGDNEFDDPFSPLSDDSSNFTQQAMNLQLKAMPTDHIAFEFSLGQSRDDLDIESSFPGFLDTRIDQASTQVNYSYADQTAFAGIDYRKENLDSNTAFEKNKRDNTGVFIGWSGSKQQQHLELSLRQDENQAYGSKTTGHIAYGYDFNDRLSFTTSYATGFKSPSFNDLYFPASSFYQPNPALTPETSETIELGFLSTLAASTFRFNAYHTEINDMISFTSDPVTFIGTVGNIDHAEVDGIEFDASTGILGNQIKVGISHMNAENKQSGEKLLRRPDTTASLSLSRNLGRLSLTLQALYNSQSEDLDFSAFPATRVKLDSYSLLNANVQYQLKKSWVLFLQANNLLDENYQTVKGYQQPGTQAFIGLRYQPE